MMLNETCYSQDTKDEIMLKLEKENPRIRWEDEVSNLFKIWCLDNCASDHMTNERVKFRKLDESVKGFVKFGYWSRVLIKGRDSIIFKCKNGEHRDLKEVKTMQQYY